MPKPLTEAAIAAHEHLFPRLAALLKQVERARATSPVPEDTVKLARELCREAQKVLGRQVALPGGASGKAPLDHQTLAVMLGQVVAGLETFEGAHSGWSAQRKCTVWNIDGPPHPVLRLLPPGSEANALTARNPQADRYREGIERRIMARYSAGYDAGYRDAQAGTPPRSEYCEMIWDKLVARRGDEAGRREFGARVPYDAPPRHLFPTGSLDDVAERQKN